MTQQKRLQALQQIARLIRDERLLALQRAEADRQTTRARIAALDAPASSDATSLAAAQRVDMLYAVWADRRRAQLNQTLARQTVTKLEHEATARQAFAKDMAIQALSSRKRP
ncbi:MAG: hypothetical protein MUD11_12050 [Rhodobacteraceae bacterium]|jgi:hypothetical protein|nr:hypothetical protein [Paracoccaceae bacterium]